VIKLLKDAHRVITVKTVVDALVLSLIDDGISMEKKYEVYDIAELNSHLIRNRVFKI